MKIKAIAFIVFAFFILLAAVRMHPFGDISHSTMDDYMIENGQNDTAANNIVTSIVFDYRGYDTLGEATVLFTAIAGVLVVLRREKNE